LWKSIVVLGLANLINDAAERDASKPNPERAKHFRQQRTLFLQAQIGRSAKNANQHEAKRRRVEGTKKPVAISKKDDLATEGARSGVGSAQADAPVLIERNCGNGKTSNSEHGCVHTKVESSGEASRGGMSNKQGMQLALESGSGRKSGEVSGAARRPPKMVVATDGAAIHCEDPIVQHVSKHGFGVKISAQLIKR
jgi:hypothetical protein